MDTFTSTAVSAWQHSVSRQESEHVHRVRTRSIGKCVANGHQHTRSNPGLGMCWPSSTAAGDQLAGADADSRCVHVALAGYNACRACTCIPHALGAAAFDVCIIDAARTGFSRAP